MLLFNILPTRRHKLVIDSVIAYFNEEKSSIPYSSKQIHQTLEWVNKHKPHQNNLLKERLAMAAQFQRQMNSL